MSTRLPSLRELEVFRATLDTGSATRAAQRLGISQPAVSRALAQLEERLGVIMFIRQSGRLTPTAEALAFNMELGPLFDGLERVRNFTTAAEAIKGGRLRVLAPPSFCSQFVVPCIVEFKQAHPSILVELKVVSTTEAVAAIAAGNADLAVTANRAPDPGVRMEPILTTQSMCMIPPGHPLGEKAVIRPEDLAGQPMIVLSRTMTTRTDVDRIFERAGVEREIVMETSTNLSSCEYVAAGLGMAVVNPFPVLAGFEGRIVARPFRPKFEHQISAMFRAHAPTDWLGRAFFAYLKRHAMTRQPTAALIPGANVG